MNETDAIAAASSRLADRYQRFAPSVRRAGHAYPVAIEALPARPVADLVVCESPLPAVIDEQLLADGRQHVAELIAAGREVTDGPVLALANLAAGRFYARASTYVTMLATTEVLSEEALRGGGDRLRSLVHEAAGADPLRSGVGRCAAIGVSVALITAQPRAVLLGRRAERLATDSGLLHLAPSGMLEPSSDPVVSTVAAELSEEIGLVIDSDALQERLRVMGIAYDLLRLRPEICLCLKLDPHETARVNLDGREFSDEVRIDPSSKGLRAFWKEHPAHLLTPAAAGAIALLEESGSLR